MKKHLLSTSAIALGVAMAAPASAQDWDLTWGGYMTQHVAYSDVSGTSAALVGADFDGIGLINEAEIIFSPSITLDNGLTFGVNVQFEATNNGGGATGIDETYMTISSDTMGQIILGSENSAGYKSMVAAPQVTSMYIHSPSISGFLPVTATVGSFGFRQAGASAYTEVAGNNDVPRITYFTPSFNGLTIGVSYAPEGVTNAGNSYSVNRNTVVSDIFDIGAYYSQEFGTTSVTIGARYGTGEAASIIPAVTASAGPDGLDGTADDIAAAPSAVNTASDPETWGVGIQIGFGDFTVGGHYAENDNGAIGGAGDQEGYSFGVTYDAAGPWAFEALAFMGEIDNGAGIASTDYDAYQIGANRDLGPGVSWSIYAIQAEFDIPVAAGGAAGTDMKGTIIGTGINLSF